MVIASNLLLYTLHNEDFTF